MRFLRRSARAAIQPDFVTLVLRGTLAGWLIALMVWLLPFAESARIWVIIILAYIVGLAESSACHRGQCRNILSGYDWRIVFRRLLHEIFASRP